MSINWTVENEGRWRTENHLGNTVPILSAAIRSMDKESFERLADSIVWSIPDTGAREPERNGWQEHFVCDLAARIVCSKDRLLIDGLLVPRIDKWLFKEPSVGSRDETRQSDPLFAIWATANCELAELAVKSILARDAFDERFCGDKNPILQFVEFSQNKNPATVRRMFEIEALRNDECRKKSRGKSVGRWEWETPWARIARAASRSGNDAVWDFLAESGVVSPDPVDCMSALSNARFSSAKKLLLAHAKNPFFPQSDLKTDPFENKKGSAMVANMLSKLADGLFVITREREKGDFERSEAERLAPACEEFVVWVANGGDALSKAPIDVSSMGHLLVIAECLGSKAVASATFERFPSVTPEALGTLFEKRLKSAFTRLLKPAGETFDDGQKAFLFKTLGALCVGKPFIDLITSIDSDNDDDDDIDSALEKIFKAGRKKRRQKANSPELDMLVACFAASPPVLPNGADPAQIIGKSKVCHFENLVMAKASAKAKAPCAKNKVKSV